MFFLFSTSLQPWAACWFTRAGRKWRSSRETVPSSPPFFTPLVLPSAPPPPTPAPPPPGVPSMPPSGVSWFFGVWEAPPPSLPRVWGGRSSAGDVTHTCTHTHTDLMKTQTCWPFFHLLPSCKRVRFLHLAYYFRELRSRVLGFLAALLPSTRCMFELLSFALINH